MRTNRYDPFRRQLNALHSDGVQVAVTDAKAALDHLRDRDPAAWQAKHETWRRGYEWGWARHEGAA